MIGSRHRLRCPSTARRSYRHGRWPCAWSRAHRVWRCRAPSDVWRCSADLADADVGWMLGVTRHIKTSTRRCSVVYLFSQLPGGSKIKHHWCDYCNSLDANCPKVSKGSLTQQMITLATGCLTGGTFTKCNTSNPDLVCPTYARK